MDQLQKKKFRETPFLPPSLPKRHLLNQSTHQPHLPKLVPLQPPVSDSSSKEQNKPVNVFKKVISRPDASLPASRLSGEADPSDLDDRLRKFINSETHRRAKPIVPTLPSTPVPGPTGLDPKAASSPSKNSPVVSEPYSPNRGLIEALSLTFDRVIAIESISYSKPQLISQGARPKTTPPNPPSFSSQQVVRTPPPEPRRTLPSLPSLHPLRSETTLPVEKKLPCNTLKNSCRKRVPSSRRTSRGLMLGQPNIGPTSLANPRDKKATRGLQRKSSISSFGSIIHMSDITKSSNLRYRRSFRHVQSLKRQSKLLTTTLDFLPSLEIPPLTFSPFLPEFGDHPSSGGSGSSTPSIITPPSFIMELPSILKREESRGQKKIPRQGRCPSTFLNLNSPITPLSFSTNQEYWTHYGTSERANISTPEAEPIQFAVQTPPSSPPPPLSNHGRSRRKLPKNPSQKKASDPINERPRHRKAMRPKLTLQVPQAISSHTTIYRPVVSFMTFTDDIKVDVRKIRPLPSIPITRQKSV